MLDNEGDEDNNDMVICGQILSTMADFGLVLTESS